MPHARSIALPCRIVKDAGCGEWAYEIALLKGNVHAGCAPADHFWAPDGEPCDEDAVPPEGEPALVAAYLIGRSGDAALVSVPGGFIGCVEAESILRRPMNPVRA